MFDLGGGELLLIVVFVLIFFGPKKLPALAQSMGRGLREFRKAQREFTEHINTAFEDEQRRNNLAGQRPQPNTIPAPRPGGTAHLEGSAPEPDADAGALPPDAGMVAPPVAPPATTPEEPSPTPPAATGDPEQTPPAA